MSDSSLSAFSPVGNPASLQATRDLQLEERLVQERRSLARELHDTISQSLTAIYLNTKFMERKVAEGDPVAVGEIAELGETIHDAVVELHGMMSRLQAVGSPTHGGGEVDGQGEAG